MLQDRSCLIIKMAHLRGCFTNPQSSPTRARSNLVLLGTTGTPTLEEGEVVEGQQWYHLKEWWFAIGSAL